MDPQRGRLGDFVPVFYPGRQRGWLTVALVSAFLTFTSCGQSGSGYPDVKATTQLNQPGVCHSCGLAIEQVKPSHVLDLKSAKYIVCSEKCGAEVRTWHASQLGK